MESFKRNLWNLQVSGTGNALITLLDPFKVYYCWEKNIRILLEVPGICASLGLPSVFYAEAPTLTQGLFRMAQATPARAVA